MRVLIQRAFSARESGFCSWSFCFRAAKELIDGAQYFLHALKHLTIPESKNPVALRLKKRGADFIFPGLLDMLRPIEFDDEPTLSRAEIRKVRPNRMLTAKFGAIHLPGSQMVPQDSFRVGLLATQATSVLLRRFDRAHRFRMFASHREKTSAKRNRILTRALNKARCTRTLTLILSLTGRGNSNRDSAVTRHRQYKVSDSTSKPLLLCPLPVRERIKVRVRIQRAFLARGTRFCSSLE